MHAGFTSDLFSIAHNTTQIQKDPCLIHSHPTYEIFYFLSGDAAFIVDEKEYRMEPHTLFIIPPNKMHAIHIFSSAPYDRYTLHFTPEVISIERRSFLLSYFPTTKNSSFMWHGIENTAIYNHLKQFENYLDCDKEILDNVLPIFIEATIAKMILSLPFNKAVDKGESEESLNNEMLNYVNTHFTEPLNLESLSARFFVSKNQVNHIFRKLTGTTVIDYIHKKRITYAHQLLLNGASASQTAIAVGFGDYTSFYRSYLKYFGHAPKRDIIKKEKMARKMTMKLPSYMDEGFASTLSEVHDAQVKKTSK